MPLIPQCYCGSPKYTESHRCCVTAFTGLFAVCAGKFGEEGEVPTHTERERERERERRNFTD